MQTLTVNYSQSAADYRLIEQALNYLSEHYRAQPDLEEVASYVGLSPYHFQRVFTRWVGISPKRFLQFLTKEHALQLLAQSSSVLETAYQTGLSGPGRLHDLLIATEAVSPGEYKNRGDGLRITYGYHDTPFGECLLARSARGVCGLHFVQGNDRAAPFEALEKRWARAELVFEPEKTAPLIAAIFPLENVEQSTPLSLHLQGTNFQIKVWEALLHIPAGQVVSYEGLAARIGRPSATRAVSRAVALNPLAVIIPCHRVIRKMGALGGYRWGLPRKQAILGWEMAKAAGAGVAV